ncbi:MAG: HesA/MoeB/ThiF family protein [Pseudomonadota bacterium]
MVLVVLSVIFWVWVLRKIGAPHAYGYALVGVISLAVLSVHLFLPDGHQLRAALGGSLRPWGILAILVGVVALYAKLLALIREKGAEKMPEKQDDGPFSTVELDRYARHIVLREIGGLGQQKLKAARVLVVGAGGLGSPILQYLAAAGVGRLGFIDDDVVSVSNLQRQVLFTEDDLDLPKVFAAEKRLGALNPHLDLRPYNRALTEEIAAELFADYDIVVDGTDSFATRALVNKTCVDLKMPLISGAISQWEGQVTVVDQTRNTPCMACLFPKEPAPGTAPSCAEGGVLGALPGIIGSIMAAEVVKVITGAGDPLYGRMLIYDALTVTVRTIEIARRDNCEVCGANRLVE